MMDRHALAIVSIVGSSLDMLGSLYLAYDLFGGQHGPLRTLTRAVTYGTLYGVGYGAILGPVFGVINGAAHGATLAWELSRNARDKTHPGLGYEAAMSALRGLGYAVGAGLLFGVPFGAIFGTLSTLGQIAGYRAGIRPTLDYVAVNRPRISKRQLLAALNRTVGYGIAGYISALAGSQRDHAMALGLEAGLVIGLVTAVGGVFMPMVEWAADHMPERRMGVIGVGLIVIGFALQSTQYWVVLLNIVVN